MFLKCFPNIPISKGVTHDNTFAMRSTLKGITYKFCWRLAVFCRIILLAFHLKFTYSLSLNTSQPTNAFDLPTLVLTVSHYSD